MLILVSWQEDLGGAQIMSVTFHLSLLRHLERLVLQEDVYNLIYRYASDGNYS